MKRVWFSLGLAIALGWPLMTMATPLAEIQRRGKLRIAVKEDVRPLGFRDQTGQLQGLEIEIAYQLAADLLGDRKAVELVPVLNQGRLDSLLTGKVDLIIAQMGVNGARARLVDFSRYYYLDGVGFVTRSPTVLTVKDIDQQRIIVLEQSEALTAVQSYFPQAQVISVKSYQEAFQLLENSQGDLFAGDQSVLTGWVQDYPQYHLIEAWLAGDALAIAIPKGEQHQELKQKINQIMQQWQANGWLQEEVKRWQLP